MLAIIVGAGASLCANAPTTADLLSLAFVSLLGVVDARLFTYLWGRARDTVRKSLESMASARLLRGETLSGMGRNVTAHGAEGRGAIRRKFKTFRFAESVPALDELRALVNDLARLKPQYGVLADEAKKMRSFLRMDRSVMKEGRKGRPFTSEWQAPKASVERACFVGVERL